MYPIRRAPRRGNPGNPFTPAELFRGGVNGVWFDPSDMGTLYQDATGLIPVTGPDQPVGLMLDKSVLTRHDKVTTGLGDWTPGNHASQATDAKRPMLRTDGRLWWLEFDGVDDYLECATFPVLDMRSVSCVFSAAQARFLQPWGEVFCLKANNSWPYNDGLSFQALSLGVFPNTSCGFSGTALSFSDDLATSLSVPRLAVPLTDVNKRVVYSIFSSPSTKVTYYNNNRINSLAGAFTSGSLLPGILFGAIYAPSGEISSSTSAGSMKLHDFVLVEKTIEQAQITKYIAIKSGVTL